MKVSRRQSLRLGASSLGALSLGSALPFAATAQSAPAGDEHMGASGPITIWPVNHASFVMQVPGMVIYADPVGDPSLYAGLPPAQLILVTHEHGDHYNADTLAALVSDNTVLVTNPAVYGMLPEDLKAKATAIANGEVMSVNDVGIEAVPAYNTTADRLQYHPEGRDNGYVVTVDDRRIYIAGDTEDIPEMRALRDIYIAFLPMNLPYTMTVEQAASAALEFKPGIVYPYHYRDSDPMAFAGLVNEGNDAITVIVGPWYA